MTKLEELLKQREEISYSLIEENSEDTRLNLLIKLDNLEKLIKNESKK